MSGESRVGAERGAGNASPDGPGDADDPEPSDAFQALGSETRLDVVRALAEAQPLAFSDLFDATDEDTSAGFAYHLRQLTGRFVRQRDDERYELTDAGRAVARSARAGTYTESVDRDPVDLEDDCPFCGATALVAAVSDNVTEIACDACDHQLLGLSLPPGGYADHEGDDLADALDAHHRRRIESFARGVCPECAGSVHGSVETADADVAPPDAAVDTARDETSDVDLAPEREYVPVQAAFECETCGSSLRCPVSLTVMDHPAVVAFYHDHGADVSERPIWNVGSEWRERLVSRDPWCVLVSVRLDREGLFLYVAGDGTVVDYRRAGPDDDEPVSQDGPVTRGESADANGGSVERAADEPAEPVESGDGATA